MMDQYFGVKELYEVVLRARTPFTFGSRYIEAGEPVIYFTNIRIATLREQRSPIMARGGWANLPHVIWEDSSGVEFTLTEGVMSSVSMGMLLSAAAATPEANEPLLIYKTEGPFELNDEHQLFLEHWPVARDKKKTFIFKYERDVPQYKVYGKRIPGKVDPFDTKKDRPCIEVYEDRELQQLADLDKKYIVDYYYEYNDDALIYTVQKERFNGLFTLEGKFYSKDENEGLDYTNIIYMPKVRVVSDINLRLGERADPATSVFNIIGMPENVVGNGKNVIMKITRLNKDIDADV